MRGESSTEPSAIWKNPGRYAGLLGVGQRDGLLGRQRVPAAVGVVADEASGRLRVQPLAHVPLRGPGARGEIGGRERARAGQRPVQPELVAHDDERGVQRGADLADGAEHEFHAVCPYRRWPERPGSVLVMTSLPWAGFAADARFAQARDSLPGAHLVLRALVCAAAPGAYNHGMLLGRIRSGATLTTRSRGRARAPARCSRCPASPGIGKTTLLDYAAAQATRSGMQVLRARGVESEAQVPFGSLLEVIRPALPLLGKIPAPHAAALEGALALRPGAASDRFAVGAATLSLLAACAEQAPAVLLLDDAQWLDVSSAQALLFAIRRLVADRIAVLITVRAGRAVPA